MSPHKISNVSLSRNLSSNLSLILLSWWHRIIAIYPTLLEYLSWLPMTVAGWLTCCIKAQVSAVWHLRLTALTTLAGHTTCKLATPSGPHDATFSVTCRLPPYNVISVTNIINDNLTVNISTLTCIPQIPASIILPASRARANVINLDKLILIIHTISDQWCSPVTLYNEMCRLSLIGFLTSVYYKLCSQNILVNFATYNTYISV